MMNRIAVGIAGLSMAFLGISQTIAGTINVPGDYALIQDAIDASSNGDVINVAAGTYDEYELNPDGKAITIQGTLNPDGSLATIIDAQQDGSVFVIDSGEGDGTLIKNLLITGGDDNYGGGIHCRNSTPIISGCTISDNTAYSGGGIYSYFSIPTISNCTISGNTADYGGGGIYLVGSPIISGCTISGNTAGVFGGGIAGLGNSNPIISNSQICGNEANQISGGYADAGGNTVADECPADDCEGDLDGNQVVDIEDLLLVISGWNTDSGDANDDGRTDIADLLLIIDLWETSCP
ncbi:MAG: hypothetical protein CMJ40_09815 [Phycisphaerae bacterium]|nr:hypothetical protein [Phycisphaerae bacterium]|tara:strand:- start:1172 stop:2053 length:882 start_codon:yes stop_codon:yes gene_type:complete